MLNSVYFIRFFKLQMALTNYYFHFGVIFFKYFYIKVYMTSSLSVIVLSTVYTSINFLLFTDNKILLIISLILQPSFLLQDSVQVIETPNSLLSRLDWRFSSWHFLVQISLLSLSPRTAYLHFYHIGIKIISLLN
jgi:hypothetical protein